MRVPTPTVRRGPAGRGARDDESQSDHVVSLFRTLLVAVVLLAPVVAPAGQAAGRLFYALAAGAALYAVGVALLLKWRVRFPGRRVLVLAADILLLTLLVRYAGGLRGGGGLFGLYYLTVIVGAMWFGVVGAVSAATLATLSYVTVLLYDGVARPEMLFVSLQRLMMPHATLLFLAAMLSAWLAEAWRAERRQVDEHRTALSQFKKQMDMAQELQSLILPPSLPRVPGVEIGVRARQAAVVVGGDYYDAVTFPDGAVGLCSADVSGKSVPGQLRLPLVKYAFRVCAQHFREPGAVMGQLGRLLYQELPREMFVSMVYLLAEPRENRLRLSRAGHCPPLRLEARTGEVSEIWQPKGVVFGVEPDLRYDVSELPFEPDDYFVLYTDGAIEAQDRRGNELEVGGLARMLKEATPESAQDLANWLFGELEAYEVGAKRDDLTLIVLRRTAG